MIELNKKQLLAQLRNAIESVLGEHNLQMTDLHASEDEFDFIYLNLSLHNNPDDGFIEAWHKYARTLGLNPALINNNVTINDITFRIVGINPDIEKFPVRLRAISHKSDDMNISCDLLRSLI